MQFSHLLLIYLENPACPLICGRREYPKKKKNLKTFPTRPRHSRWFIGPLTRASLCRPLKELGQRSLPLAELARGAPVGAHPHSGDEEGEDLPNICIFFRISYILIGLTNGLVHLRKMGIDMWVPLARIIVI
jgi:hypothetical protein